MTDSETNQEVLKTATKHQLAPKYNEQSNTGGIFIQISNSKKYIKYYGKGKKFSGNDIFAIEVLKSLNIIHKIPNGKIVLDHFINISNNKIYIKNISLTDTAGTEGSVGVLGFVPYTSGNGGIIKTGDILKIGEYEKYQSLSHEFYHAYQNDNFFTKKTFGREISADLFGTYIANTINFNKSESELFFFGNLTTEGIKYQDVMKKMVKSSYNKKDYETAIKCFANGSNMNFNNTYVKFGYKQDVLPLKQTPLIAQFNFK